MRAQPFHLGHLNLILNTLRIFHDVRIIVGNQPCDTQTNPFKIEQRINWILTTLHEVKIKNIEIRPGAHGKSKGVRHRTYLEPNQEKAVIVSGNFEVINRWQQEGIPCLRVQELELKPLVPNLPSIMMIRLEGNGRLIRKNLTKARGLLPEMVAEDISNK